MLWREPELIFQLSTVSWHKIHPTVMGSVHFCKTKCLAASPIGTGHLWSAVGSACSLGVSGNQGHLVRHQTPLVGQLHLSHMCLAMGAGGQEQANFKCECYQGRAKDSWHPLLLVIWWGYYLDSGLPKYIPAITQTHSSTVFHLKLLCTCWLSTQTLEWGEIIWVCRL